MAFTCNLTKWVETNLPASFKTRTGCMQSPYYDPFIMDMLAGQRDSIDPMLQASLGICGTPQYLDASSPTSTIGKYYVGIVVIRDCTLNVTAGQTNEINGSGADVNLAPLSGATIPAGTILLGNWKKIVLLTGHVKLMPHPFL